MLGGIARLFYSLEFVSNGIIGPMKEPSGRIRIALALEYPLLQQGGTEALVRELLLGLAGRFEIVLVTGDRDRAALGERFSSLISEHLSWNKGAPSRHAAQKLAQALVEKRVKLVHFHCGSIYEWQSQKAWQSPLYYLTRAGVPCVMTSHLVPLLLDGFTRPERPAWQKVFLLPKAWFSKALLLHWVRAEFLVSKHDQGRMRRLYPMFAGKIRQMYHSRLVRDRAVSLNGRKKIVFCLGAFCERKAQVTLCRAFASLAKRYPDWTLNLMGPHGEGDYLREVEAVVARSGIAGQVQLTPAGDPRPLLETAAIFAMPSLLEGLPLSLQEALYHGCACVASSVSGIPELIEHEKTGLLIPPGDERALAAALDRLMGDPELRARLARRGHESIIERGLLAEVMVENHARLYEAILAGKSPVSSQPASASR